MALLLLPQVASAQEAAQPGATAGAADSGGQDDDQIGDIVVTARYVSERVQDAPMAITAQTDTQLQAANVTNIGTLGAVVPNLQTVPGDAQSAGTPFISLRGVQQGATSSLAVPPAIAIYTDDVYHATTAGSELDFTDVVRVEVNRGPQSTLSGNASIGGSIKLFTQDPKGDGSGFISLGGGTRKHMEASGAIDLGITPTLSMRALGHFDRQEGFGNRLDFTCMMKKLGTPALAGTTPYFQPDSDNRGCVIGHTGGGTAAVGQVKLLWKPADNVSLLLTGRHREEDMEETNEVTLFYQKICTQPTPEFPQGIGVQPCPLSGTGAVLGTTQLYQLAVFKAFGVVIDNRFMPPERNGGIYDTYGTNCRPDIDLTVKVGTTGFPAGYPDGLCYSPNKTARHTQLSAKLEVGLSDDVNLTAIGGYTNYANEFSSNGDATPYGVVLSHFNNVDKMYSGELRLDGKLFDGRLQWIVGAFAMKLDGYQKNLNTSTNSYQKSVVHGVDDSQSGFVHFDFNITDAWRVSGGGRYSYTDINISIDNPQALSFSDRHSTQKRWDWLLSTDYKITDDVMIYATAATGSRPPGLITIVQDARQVGPTSEEELVSYELGLKADFLDRHLRTNLTAFYLDYKKLSTGVTGTQCLAEPGTGQATFYNLNFTSAEATALCQQLYGSPSIRQYSYNVGIPAKVKGFEWEITALPLRGLRIDWTGGYNKFTSGITTPGQPGYLWPGNHRQAEWNMHANVSYDIETSAGTITPRLDWNWQSQQDYDTSSSTRPPQAAYIIPAYSMWNGQIAYESPDGDWSATLSGTNLANRFTYYQMMVGQINSRARVGPPREWMLTLRKKF
ncbi:TonB-dependent receptor [Sphingobium nicotianae]|uniref:TonB-dependent receptor n=1 Tax=Sphingobium nicotianae TaxID=2782607 RepID=A0A9X1DAE9_9SPHN|nr:TonB-dependent receptor [Sphingobium nicotianae]MBT2186334.1 TonB-dependent receptor [Sphingobium nicotianae]